MIEADLYLPSLPCPCMGGKGDRRAEALNLALLEKKAENPSALTLRVFALNQNLAAFKANPVVAGLLQNQGHDALPALFVNGRLVASGRYPDPGELADLLAG